MNLSERLARWRVDPRPVFVIDGVGAVTSAVLLGLVLPFGAEKLGTTREALWTLAVFPLIYAAIDVACVVVGRSRSRTSLVVIAVLNAAYPLITASVLGRDGVALSALGAVYFVVECGIVITLAGVELHLARRLA